MTIRGGSSIDICERCCIKQCSVIQLSGLLTLSTLRLLTFNTGHWTEDDVTLYMSWILSETVQWTVFSVIKTNHLILSRQLPPSTLDFSQFSMPVLAVRIRGENSSPLTWVTLRGGTDWAWNTRYSCDGLPGLVLLDLCWRWVHIFPVGSVNCTGRGTTVQLQSLPTTSLTTRLALTPAHTSSWSLQHPHQNNKSAGNELISSQPLTVWRILECLWEVSTQDRNLLCQ